MLGCYDEALRRFKNAGRAAEPPGSQGRSSRRLRIALTALNSTRREPCRPVVLSTFSNRRLLGGVKEFSQFVKTLGLVRACAS